MGNHAVMMPRKLRKNLDFQPIVNDWNTYTEKLQPYFVAYITEKTSVWF